MSGSQPSITEIAALVGNPARANMLTVLLDSRALTATELAYVGGVSPQTASGHLGRLTESGLLVVCKQGRHSYFRLASPMVARMLEGIMAVAAQETPPRYRLRWRGDEALRTARTCYDHPCRAARSGASRCSSGAWACRALPGRRHGDRDRRGLSDRFWR
jgi:DNA-binding transcriptional ArsR family regulator